jgi:DNA-binding protein HU-beta
MNRRELVKAIAAQTETDAKTVDAVLKGFTDVTTAVVSKGEPVAISGFCKFSKVERAARMGRNPATGEAIKIKASKKARITPLKGFKDIVLGASPAPKLTKPTAAKAGAAKATSKTPAKSATATKTSTARTAAPKAPARTRVTKAAPVRKSPGRTATKRG